MFALYTKSNGRSNRERVLLPHYTKCINITGMTINQKEKGKRGEREAAQALNRLLLTEARRGQQNKGTDESPDVIVPDSTLHPEVKRCETLSLYKAIAQAIHDAGESKIPFVMHKRNYRQWLFVIPEDRLLDFVEEIYRIRHAE
jgi:hypothetical protein